MATHVDDPVAAVLELHRRLSEGVALQEVGDAAVRHVARLMQGTAALWLVQPDDAVEAVAMAHPDPTTQASLLRLTGGRITGPHRFVRSLLSTGGQTRLGAAELGAAAGLMEPAYRAWFTEHPPCELVLQPLRMAGQSIGMLGVARDAEQAPLGPGEHAFLMQIAQIVSVALQTQRLQQVQQDLLRQARGNEQRLDVLAHTDDLTELPNRRGFLRVLQRLEDPLASPVGVALLDLNDFKDVNDGFGHAAGDGLLAAYARQLSAALPPGAVVARMGGDEFAVLLRADTPEGLEPLLRDVLAASPATVRVAHVDVPVRVSAGLAVRASGARPTAADLLREADVAMYRAKREGVPLAGFDARADAAALSRLHEAAELRGALADGALTVHYQRLVPGPRTPAPAERFEALVRWPAADGLRLPGAFLPLAREIGVMDELTDLVVDRVLEQLSQWQADGRRAAVAVNLPARALARPGFADRLVERLRGAGLPASALSLEITEHELIDDGVRAAVAGCRALGLDVAIDDFGMGYSALGYLLEVPATELKIDRSLVSRLHEERPRRVLVEHCVALAHALGVRVVAEGVETQEEQQVLLDLGADWLQGYHLHRPCPPDQLPGTGPLAGR